jgi:hypothetical protein
MVPAEASTDAGVVAVIPPKRRIAAKSAAASASSIPKDEKSGEKPASPTQDPVSTPFLGKIAKARQKSPQNTAAKIAKPTRAKATSAPVWVDVKRKPSPRRPRRVKAE